MKTYVSPVIYIAIIILMSIPLLLLLGKFWKPDGQMVINRTDPDKDVFKLVCNENIELWPFRKMIFIKIVLEDELQSKPKVIKHKNE